MKISRYYDPAIKGTQFAFPSGVNVSIRRDQFSNKKFRVFYSERNAARHPHILEVESRFNNG